MRMSPSASNLFNVLVVSLGLSSVQSLSAVAGTIIFRDLSDTVTVDLSADILDRAFIDCSGEVCTVVLLPPNRDDFGGNFASTNIFEPSSAILSDTMLVDIFPDNQDARRIIFTSDSEGGPGLVPLPGANAIFEDGTVQFATSVTWLRPCDPIPGAPCIFPMDDIFFQSDIEPQRVPEPSTMSLMLVGFAALGGFRLLSRVSRGFELLGRLKACEDVA